MTTYPSPFPDLNIPAVSLGTLDHQDRHLLLWQVQGTTELATADTSATVTGGNCLWLAAGIRPALVVQENSIMLPMFFDVATTATTLAPQTTVPIDDARLPTLALALIQSQSTAATPPASVPRQILSLLEKTPAHVYGLTLPTSPTARTVAEALLFDPGDDRLVHDWAVITGTSTRSIERAFLRETGLTLQQWRLKCRMHTAALLLARASPVAAVAHRVGYENHSSFGRVFKSHFGVSPTEFRSRTERSVPTGP